MIISTISNRFAHPVCAPAVDVCLIAEGCYPHIAGGVSSWIDWLMRTQEQKRFVAVSIVTGRDLREPRYKFPDNLTCCSELILQGAEPARLTRTRSGRTASQELAQVMVDLVRGGGLAEYARMVEIVNEQGGGLSHHDLMASQLSFDVIRYMYDAIMPHASFLQFFWAWRALFGGLFSTLKFAIPQAGVYHAISTGYAGLLAARATLETGRPAVVTEHGIYTNERRIEILMADWISDSVDKGLALDDERTDLRDLWVKVFEAYARICYQACSEITTLYSDNQQLQRASGAQAHRLKVLANGIDLRRFESLLCAAQTMRPTMALIGRVVPIKDVKTFISAAAIVRERIPNLHALVMGPTDEDPEYFNECSQLVAELGLSESLTFTGNVRITDLMPSIHVVVLTSLSEAQPLVLLEAGAAGIPSVATNVGACREIIEGSSEETAPEPGGYVTDLVAPEQVADSIWRLITNESLRRRFGETMRQRVRDYYASDMAQKKYASLYHDLLAMPTTRNRPEFV